MWLQQEGFAVDGTMNLICLYPKVFGVPVGYIIIEDTKATLYENRLDKKGDHFEPQFGRSVVGKTIEEYDLHNPESLPKLSQDIKNHFQSILSVRRT
jgi:hypothetical protein